MIVHLNWLSEAKDYRVAEFWYALRYSSGISLLMATVQSLLLFCPQALFLMAVGLGGSLAGANAQSPQVVGPANPGLTFQGDVSVGHSSNVAQFEGSPAGSFIQSSQSLDYKTALREEVQLHLQGGGYFRNFTDPEINDNFRMAVYQAEGSVSALLNPEWDLGFKLSGESFDGRELDFTNNLGNGRDFRFFSIGGAGFLRHYRQNDMFEIKVSQNVLNALTTTIDERGNLFRNSVNTTTAKFQYGRRFSEDWTTEFSYSFLYKKYLERRARFSDGSIDPGFQNEFLIENEHQLLTRSYIYSLQIDLGFKYIEDRIFGAETNLTGVAEVSLPTMLADKIMLRPFAQWTPSFYTNFVGDIINNPNARELRTDQLVTYGIDGEISLGWLTPIFSYQHSTLNSNYEIINFTEDVFSAGARISF